MLKIAFNEILIKWKNTIISAILFGVILTLVVAGISTYERVYSKYKPFKELFKKNGYFVTTHPSQLDEYLSNEEIMKKYVKAEESYSSLQIRGDEFNNSIIKLGEKIIKKQYEKDEYNNSIGSYIINDGEKLETGYEILGYNKFIGKYIPNMKKGVWYTKADSVEGQIEVVITSETQGLEFGDYFKIDKFDEAIFHVCGVTEPNISYFNLTRVTRYASVFDYYELLSDRIDNKMVMFSDYDKLIELSNNERDIVEAPLVFGIFKEGSEVDPGSTYGVYTLWDSFETMRKNTKQTINENVNEVLPVFIAIIILSILSLICSVAIDVTFSLGNYASLYISGMKWKDIIYLNMIKVFFQAAIGFVLMFGIETYFKKIFGDMFIFSFGLSQIIGCVVVTLIVLLVTCIMPLIIIKTKSPTDVLRESRIQ